MISRDKFSVVLQDIAFSLWQQIGQSHALPMLRNSRRVLEFGCGAGIFTYCYADTLLTDEWILCDRSVPSDLIIPAESNLMLGELPALLESLPKHYYDCVLSNCTLHDLTNCEDAVAMLATALKPDGLMAISVLTDEHHHLDYWYNLCAMFFEILAFESYTIITGANNGDLHQYQPLMIIGIAK